MSSRNQTPATLQPYLDLPVELSLTLLTGTLACSATWLTARLAAAALTNDGVENASKTGLVLVSWMRTEHFWNEQLKRIGALNPRKPSLTYKFVDRLSCALRFPAYSAELELQDVERQILNAVRQHATDTSAEKVMVVLDGLDALLATHSAVDVVQLNAVLLRIRANTLVHNLVLSVVADSTLLVEREKIATPLETANSGFLLSQAHLARTIISVRELATGSARDVSGIIRITRGGSPSMEAQDMQVEELEKRYLVQRDGSVKLVE